MTTWDDLLGDIRSELNDTGETSQRWSDRELYVWFKDAARDYSTYFPVEAAAELTITDGKAALPADFIKEITVECPADTFLEPRQVRPGTRYYTYAGEPTHYYIKGGYLYVNGAVEDGTSVLLTYDALYDLPADETDGFFELTIPDVDEELIRIYVRAKANAEVRSQQANLDRFRPGSGKRDDNPLRPEVANLMDEYHAKIAERFPGGTVLLYRAGRLK